MNMYLIVCGVILNVVVLLTIIYYVFDVIRVRKALKRIDAEHAQKQEQFKKELALAKQTWQKWRKINNELVKKAREEKDEIEKWSLQSGVYNHQRIKGHYYFQSIQKTIPFYELRDKYNWVLEDDQDQKETKPC